MSESSSGLAENYARLEAAIARACLACGRDPAEVRLLAVSKSQPLAVLRAALAIGLHQFGENRVKEMAAKADELGPGISWVLIGHLQRNKVALAARVIDELQSLDSLALAGALQRQSVDGSAIRRLPVLVEVNTSGESSKSGILPERLLEFTTALRDYPGLEPRGLMTVAHPDPALAAQGFARLAELRRRLQDRDGGGWAELSMGMSGDFAAAIAHGSTCLRIGTALFGQRQA